MPDDAQETTGENVSLDQATEALKQAAADADDREEEAIDWSEVIEIPTSAMTEETFSDRIGQRFEIELGLHDAQVELKTVTRLSDGIDLGAGAPAARPHFSVVFQGHGPRANLPEGIYRLRHEDLGEFEVYLRPTQPAAADTQDATQPHLEATFS